MSPVNILDFSGEIVGVCRYKFPGWKYFTVEIPLTHTHRWKVQASMGYDGYGYKGLIWVILHSLDSQRYGLSEVSVKGSRLYIGADSNSINFI
jgi:hypothetical protein